VEVNQDLPAAAGAIIAPAIQATSAWIEKNSIIAANDPVPNSCHLQLQTNAFSE